MAAQTEKTSQQPNHFKNLSLLFAIPIGIAVLAALLAYVPRLLAHPTSDFIYSSCDSYVCSVSYRIGSSGEVTEQFNKKLSFDNTPSLRYYHAKTNTTSSVTLQQVRHYRLDSSSRSPDGYHLERENSDTAFPFSSDNGTQYYLVNGIKRKPVDLLTDKTSYTRSINFLGWTSQ